MLKNKQNTVEYSYDTKIDTNYLFIIVLLYFIQPNFSSLENSSMNFELNKGLSVSVTKEILQMQMNYSVLVLVIVLFYLKHS